MPKSLRRPRRIGGTDVLRFEDGGSDHPISGAQAGGEPAGNAEADHAAIALPNRALHHRGQFAFGAAAHNLDPGAGGDPGLESHADKCNDEAAFIFHRKIGDLARIVAVTNQFICESSPDAIHLGSHEIPSPSHLSPECARTLNSAADMLVLPVSPSPDKFEQTLPQHKSKRETRDWFRRCRGQEQGLCLAKMLASARLARTRTRHGQHRGNAYHRRLGIRRVGRGEESWSSPGTGCGRWSGPAAPGVTLHGLDLEFVEGDMRDAPSVRRAMAGIRYVFHVAADYRLWARDKDEIFAANVDGTRIVMQEALRAGVERVVYTSSVATLGLRPDGSPADESVPLSLDEGIGAYKRSKIAAERLVEAMVADDALPAVIVNPSTPIGPRDVRPTPTGRIVVEAARGRMPGFVDTGLNLVHVDDVAEGHIAALKRGAIGERYILGGENVLLADMLAEIARLTGRRPPRLRIPRAAVFPVAYLAEAAARITGREPFATLDGLRMAAHRMFFTAAKAERDLGFRARPYREALSDAIQWFRANGYLDGERRYACTSA